MDKEATKTKYYIPVGGKNEIPGYIEYRTNDNRNYESNVIDVTKFNRR
jgi:hypothetical protein